MFGESVYEKVYREVEEELAHHSYSASWHNDVAYLQLYRQEDT